MKIENVRNETSNHEILKEYMLHLELANRSEHTLKGYLYLLERFLRDTPVAIQELSSDDVRNWLEIYGKDKKETTLVFGQAVLSSFFTFCVEEGYMKRSPMKSRWRPRLPQPIPRYLEREELAKLRGQSELGSLQEQLLFELLVSSGCRISEGLMLNIDDVNIEERTGNVKGKGGRIRTVHFSDKCAILLKGHLKQLPEDTQEIFINQNRNRLTRRHAHKIFSKMGERAGLDAPMGPHRLRHTFATTLLAKGADLMFISEELGHRDLSTTLVYARLPKEALVSMYRKFMG